jgi:hypothetical protein
MTYSYTQISQYLSCPRRYRHRYLDGWQEKDTRAPMLFGRAFEQAIAALFRREDPAVLFEQWALCKDMGLTYSANDNWDRMLQQGIQLLERFAQDNRVRIRRPRSTQQVRFNRALACGNDFVSYIDAVGELDGTPCILEWKTTSARYPEEPIGISALDPQLVCYSWMTGIEELPKLFLSVSGWSKFNTSERGFPRSNRRSSQAWSKIPSSGSNLGCFFRTVAFGFLKIPVQHAPSSGSASISRAWLKPALYANRELILVCLTSLFTKYPPMLPKLNRK